MVPSFPLIKKIDLIDNLYIEKLKKSQFYILSSATTYIKLKGVICLSVWLKVKDIVIGEVKPTGLFTFLWSKHSK